MRVGNPRVVPSTFVAVAVPPLSSTRLLIAKSCLEFHIESFIFYLNLDRPAILKHKILPHQYIFHFCLFLFQFQLVFLVEFEA